jgi:CMP-N-acetylneuraminic acid synthetase
MNIVAMIPAREGSKGIVNKNLRLIGDKPLILYTIKAAKESKRLARVLFSTDSPRMREIALRSGIEAPFLRPRELAEDMTCMVEVMKHCVEWLTKSENYRPDLIVTLYPTSPFRTGWQIDQAIELFLSSGADCLVSVSKQKHHPYWSLDIDENGRLCHYFGKDKIFYRRQDMPETYEQNGAIYIVPADRIDLLDRRSMAENTLPFLMEGISAINIDDELDLILADAIARNSLKISLTQKRGGAEKSRKTPG